MKTKLLLTCFFSLWLVACTEQQLEAPPTSQGISSELLQEQKPKVIPGVQPPAEVLAAMNRNYNESQNNCREYGTNLPRGHYYCSGVLLRTVDDGNFNPWTYSPSSIALGATSYSWIRQDVNNTTLYHPAGFILRNKAEANSHGLRALETGFICLYPFDAATVGNTNHQGCGVRGFKTARSVAGQPLQNEVKNNNPYGWGSCDALGITTVAQWNAYFIAHGSSQQGQCSWNIENQSSWNAMIASRPAFPLYAYLWNEIMLNNLAGDNGDSLKPFIAAFFYDVHKVGSLATARNFQAKLNANGYNVPILRLDFTAVAAQRFAYLAADQAVPQ